MIRSGDDRTASDSLIQTITDYALRAFQLTSVSTILLLGWLIWGLFSGRLADAAGKSAAERQQVIQTVQSISLWLNVSLLVNLVSCCIAFYEEVAAGYVLLLLAAGLAFGLPYIPELLPVDNRSFTAGGPSAMTLQEIHLASILFAIAGGLLFLRNMFARFVEMRTGQDLTQVTYGKEVGRQNVPKALVPALAKCWQLPFCREGVRTTCPIYHAKTKCWKQGVGCMCEENIIRLAMADGSKGAPPTVEMARGQGFVAIGDLITASDSATRPNIQTRPGPNGVRIPVNPHITPRQQKMRCHNCIIYNEHQRQKYRMLAPLVTLAVPLLVFLEFDNLRELIHSTMKGLDKVFGRLALDSSSSVGIADKVTGSISVEMILIGCITLVVMTWALRFLEYCTFKIKI